MRLPGVHVLLTAGVVAVTSIGTVTAFSLTGAASGPALPPAAPPPAASAPAVPAPPLPAPPPSIAPQPVVETEEPAPETTRAAPRSSTEDEDGARSERRDRAAERSERNERRQQDRPGRDRSNDRFENQVEYACQEGYVDEEYCRN
ncbi:hypothetical protein [Pseudonocardia sp. KRD291]|uniref:hypothetical protein n=1 Tax=Pseudonocardia sp. KRD291 TaxID=2792007 RepID=UPI001C49D0D8|nr:hypothetical protein [Pseudonocardia sp. KRD291]MBW0101595.1 hypothetical protein [Pseudonocardia sp. KRD291]